MDPLFWILAGVVVGCVIGIIIVWRLETQATRRIAAAKQAEAEAARLNVFDPRAAVEEIDTRPLPAAPQPGAQAARPGRQDAASLPEIQLRPPLAAAPGENGKSQANGKAGRPIPPEILRATPEEARLRAAELGRERRYLEQAIEEQQARIEQMLHSASSGAAEPLEAVSLLQSELAQQRHHLEEISFLEERYRQVAVPSLEPLAQRYKKAASAQIPRAFGVRRHSLARIEPPGQHPPAQATTDPSS